jgi:heme exporter protein D
MVVLILLVYPIVHLVLNRLNYFQRIHSLKKIETRLHTFLENYSEKKIDASDAIKLKGELAIKNLVVTYFNYVLPTFSYLLLIVIAIAHYSPFIALICVVKIFILIVWIKNFSLSHGPMVDQNVINWKHRSLNFLKYHSLTISYALTHGHRREMLVIFARYFSLVIAISLFLRGRIKIGSIYAIYIWTGDVFTSLQNVVTHLESLKRDHETMSSYLKRLED